MAYSMLYVDDERDLEDIVRQRLGRRIRKGEIDFHFAGNGVEALKELAAHPEITVVFSDINMPEMDGLTLLKKILELGLPIRTVIVSAYGDMDNLRHAMNVGAYDFIVKPIDFRDLEATLDKAIEEIKKEEQARETKATLTHLRNEMDYAGQLQRRILPTSFPESDHYKLFAKTLAAQEVGGDFYDFFNLDSDLIGFAIADISGKGMPAAIFMAVCRTILFVSAASLKDHHPTVTVKRTNDLLSDKNPEMFFATTFYGTLNLKTGLLRYCNAGHLPPLLIGAGGEISELPCSRGVPLGVEGGFSYDEGEYTMKPGEMLYLFTDGVSEAHNADSELYSEERLKKLLEKEGASADPVQVVDAVWNSVEEFRGETKRYDDITQLAIQYTGAAKS